MALDVGEYRIGTRHLVDPNRVKPLIFGRLSDYLIPDTVKGRSELRGYKGAGSCGSYGDLLETDWAFDQMQSGKNATTKRTQLRARPISLSIRSIRPIRAQLVLIPHSPPTQNPKNEPTD